MNYSTIIYAHGWNLDTYKIPASIARVADPASYFINVGKILLAISTLNSVCLISSNYFTYEAQMGMATLNLSCSRCVDVIREALDPVFKLHILEAAA